MQLYGVTLPPIVEKGQRTPTVLEPIRRLNVCDVWRIKDESMLQRVCNSEDYVQIFHNGKPYLVSHQALNDFMDPEQTSWEIPVSDPNIQTEQHVDLLKVKKKRKKHDKRHVWSKEENMLFEDAIRIIQVVISNSIIALQDSGKRPKPKSIKAKMEELGYCWEKEFPDLNPPQALRKVSSKWDKYVLKKRKIDSTYNLSNPGRSTNTGF
jgi:hypothetical protein